MEELRSSRMGNIIPQPNGYKAFIPSKLCTGEIKVQFDEEMISLLSEADRALGELKGMTETLQNPDLFIAYYVRKEALLSSQIEGTECSLDEVIQVDEENTGIKPVHEVINYIEAMNEGLEKLKTLPLSLRLINDIHRILLSDVRGREKKPGEFKRYQNWIGPPGCLLGEAGFVPPPPSFMMELMGDWENYYHQEKKLPPLIEAALLHSQIETIHPYADGNGRIGRLLITFMLCARKVLDRPLLYLSLFFKEHRSDYYKLLMDVRFKGELEGWIKFFLRGVRNTSLEAVATAHEIRELHEADREKINTASAHYKLSHPLFRSICENPIVSISRVVQLLDTTYPTAKKTIETFVELDILQPYQSNTLKNGFSYMKYLEILRRGT